VEPLIPSCSHVPFGDVTALMLAVSEKTAAVILEPIQGEAGIVVPPPGFLREVRKICDFHGAFLILDEVQTGLGRTGKNFACEWEDVSPDILCLGKALGGGVMPLAGVVATAQAFKPLIDDPVFHTSTFGGNPLACVAGLAALRILVRDQLAQNAFLRGQYLLRGLQDLADAYPDLVLEVRGRGLMVGVEMHRPGQVGVLISLLRKRGILVCHTIEESGVIRLEPPLGITTVLIDYIVSNFKTALEEARQVLAS
jgi:putrescine aminotransferase